MTTQPAQQQRPARAVSPKVAAPPPQYVRLQLEGTRLLLSSCTLCGAVVEDHARHTQWHTTQGGAAT